MATPTPAPKAIGCEQYRTLIAKYSWDVDTAMAVMEAESTTNGISCNPMADNTGLNRDGSNDKGLFQINSIHRDLIGDTERFEPARNIDVAFQIYRGAKYSWTPWSAYNSGKYLKFM